MEPQTATETGTPTTGTAPGQAASPNGSTTAASPAQASVQEQLAEAERRGMAQGRAEAQAEGQRAYAGLQRTLSSAQSELARARANADLLSAIPALVRGQQELILATKGPEAAQQFAQSVENETLKAQLAAAKQPPVTETLTPAPPGYEPARQPTKAEVLHRFYPDTDLSADDPLIDYAGNAGSVEEALRRFHSSVGKATATRAAERASQATAAAASETTRETLVRAGVETTDGTLPAGSPRPRPADDDPSKWNSRQMLTQGFIDSGDPHDKLLERQARRTRPGEKERPAAATVPVVAAR